MKLNRTLVQWMSICLVIVGMLSSCDTTPPVETDARFEVMQDADNPLMFTFTNVSLGEELVYSWDFGDGNTSVEESPVHTYAAEGEYTVTLSATGADEMTDTRSETISATDPLAAQKELAGDVTKTWKLIRDGAALYVGSNSGDGWWGIGGGWATQPYDRPCLYNDTWVFTLADGTFTYDDGGDVWGEWPVWQEDKQDMCLDASDPSNWLNNNGDDVSAWGSGSHEWIYDPLEGELTVVGTGAWIGLAKAGTDADDAGVPLDEVTYTVVDLITVEGSTDTLRLRTELAAADGYWLFTLVSYNDAADEPELGTPPTSDKPYESNDIFDNFAADGNSNITWDVTEVTGWTTGVANPDGVSDFLVGQYDKGEGTTENLRAELAYRMDLSTRNQFSAKVYFPSSNDYTTEASFTEGWAPHSTLQKQITLRFYNTLDGAPWESQSEVILTIEDAQLDTWVDLTFDFSFVGDNDIYDMIIFQLGSEGHNRPGTFYMADFQLNP